MANLFGLGRVNTYAPPATGLRLTTSLYGRPKPIVYGQTRVSPTLIDYDGFSSTPANQGGKGGAGGSGGNGKGNAASYDYTVSAIASFGEQISQVLTVYNGSAVDFIVTPNDEVLSALANIGITPSYGDGVYNIEFHNGTSDQAVSPYWSSAFPGHALAYRNEALAIFPNLGLGSSSSFPNFTFEVLGVINSDIPALGPDANPADVVADLLTNPVYGVNGFKPSFLGNFDVARNYWRATGLLVSDALTNATAANSYLKGLLEALNADFRWSNGLLEIVPFGDVAITANGYTYTPNVTPIYDLTVDDFISTSDPAVPVSYTRKSPTDINNKIQIEYLDRNSLYNPSIVYASDEGSIAQTWLRTADKKSCYFFSNSAAAQMSAGLQLHRQAATASTYTITVGKKYGLLEPLDLITITEPALQLNRQLCRILEISEDSNQLRTLTLEVVPLTAAAPVYGVQAGQGAGRNSNAPASSVNAPIFYEPPDQLGQGLVLFIGLSGSVPGNFGGCSVWISSDGNTYRELGTFNGTTRMGVLSADLNSVVASSGGITLDSVNALSVDLSESNGILSNGSANDFAALNTAVLVGQEILAYQNATLTGANKYNLSPLNRGAYGSAISAHAAGTPFMRLDGNVFQWDYTSDRIGQTVYFKFLAFNQFGNGSQNLADVGAYAYTLTGHALSSPLANVTNVRALFEANVTKIWWDEISDFRPVSYEIRKGASWPNALTVSTQAHPPFVTVGDDTYWVAAKTIPASGIVVYSAVPQAISLNGTLLAQNVVVSYDEKANGWTGSLANGAAITGSGSSGYLTYQGAAGTTGYYETNPFNVVNVGYTAQCLVTCNYQGSGVPIGQNILSVSDVLGQSDILGSYASRQVDVRIEIATCVSPQSDIFTKDDVFAQADVFAGAINWSPWQKFVPGVYLAQYVKFRVVLTTNDPTIMAACAAMKFVVTVPTRHDHYQNLSIPASGLEITFQPDGAQSPAPFNGGPNGQALPYLTAVWNGQAGDTLSYTVTNSSATIQILNGGVGVARAGANIDVEGY